MEKNSQISNTSAKQFYRTGFESSWRRDSSQTAKINLQRTTIQKVKQTSEYYSNIFEQSNPLKDISVESDSTKQQGQPLFTQISQIYQKWKVFSYFRLILNLIFLAVCIVESLNHKKRLENLFIIELACQVYFSLNIILCLPSYDTVNKTIIAIEIFTNIAAYSTFFMYESHIVRYTKALRAVRVVLLIYQVSFLKNPCIKMLNSLRSACKILLPALFFVAFYALAGLYYFSDLEYNKCRTPDNKFLTENWTVYENQIFLCGNRQCPQIQGVQLECLNPIDYGVEPNPHQIVNMVQGNGLLHYQNIFFALVSTLKQAFITGSSRLIILHKQAMNQIFVIVYYMSFIYLLYFMLQFSSYIYLNIFYGLMMLNEQNQHSSSQPVSQDMCSHNNSSVEPKRLQQLNVQNIESQKSYSIPQVYSFRKMTDEQNKKSQKEDNLASSKFTRIHNEPQNNNTLQYPQITKTFNQQLDVIWNVEPSQPMSSFSVVQLEGINSAKNVDFEQSQVSIKIHRNSLINQRNQSQMIMSDFQNQQLNGYQQKTFNRISKMLLISKHFSSILLAINLSFLSQMNSQPKDFYFYVGKFFYYVGILDLVFLFIFSLEILTLVIISKKYYKALSKANLIEISILAIVWIGTIYSMSINQGIQAYLNDKGILRFIFCSLKYFKVLILISETNIFEGVRAILNCTIQAVTSLKSFILLWLYTLLTFSLIGGYLFANRTKLDFQGNLDIEQGKSNEFNFDNIYNSIVFTCLVYYNEEWDILMFEQYLGSGYEIVIWQYFTISIGFVVVSKYYLAYLIEQIGKRLDQDNQFLKTQCQIPENYSQKSSQYQEHNKDQVKESQSSSSMHKMTLKTKTPKSNFAQIQSNNSESQKNDSIASFDDSKSCSRSSRKSQQINALILNFQNQMNQQTAERMFSTKTRKQHHSSALASEISGKNMLRKKQEEKEFLKSKHTQQEGICFSRIKETIRDHMSSKTHYVGRSIIVIFSCLSQILLDKHAPQEDNQISVYLLATTTCYFTIECLVGIWVYGIRGQFSFFKRSYMNCLNVVLIVLELMFYHPEAYDNHDWICFVSTFRCFRILNLLDFQYRYDKNMRLTAISFIKLMPKVISLLIIMLTFYSFFALFLTYTYSNSFRKCVNYPKASNIVSQQDCYNWGGDWVEDQISGSSFVKSLLYLFLIATTEGWSSLMSTAASITGQSLQPTKGHNPVVYYMFIAFFFFGNMIILNMFIGISIYNFKKIKQEATGQDQLDANGRQWFSIKSQIYRMSPVPLPTPPENYIRSRCFHMIKSQYFRYLKIVLGTSFLISMCFYKSNQDQKQRNHLFYILYGFMVFNVFQYLCCWVSYGLKLPYWGQFGKIIFIGQTGGVVMLLTFIVVKIKYSGQLSKENEKIFTGFLIHMNIGKAFSILSEIQFMRRMASSLLSVIPQTLNLFLIIFMVLYIYTMIGVELFSYLKFNTQLNEHDQNYKDFSHALYSLVKFSTMQSPIAQISDASSSMAPNFVCFQIQNYADYAKYGQNGCGNQFTAFFFFLSFHILYSLILISTVMAITFDAYSQVHKEEQALVNKFQLEQVKNQWAKYDTQATGFLMYRDFWLFTAKLIKIYSFDKSGIMSNTSKQQFLESLNIPIYQGSDGVLSFQFHEVIEGLTRVYLLEKRGDSFDTSQTDQLFEDLQMNQQNFMIKKSIYNSSQVLSLIIIKSGLKAWNRKAKDLNQHSFEDKIKFLGKNLIAKSLYTESKPIDQYRPQETNAVQQKEQKSLKKGQNDFKFTIDQQKQYYNECQVEDSYKKSAGALVFKKTKAQKNVVSFNNKKDISE